MNKIRLGFFSFTEITDPGEHHSYNEWHQLDHMPEQYPARRASCTGSGGCRRRRAGRRAPSSEPPLDPIHYVTLYLMTEPIERDAREFMQLGRDLHDVGPLPPAPAARTSRGRSAFVDDRGRAARARSRAAAVPYRPNRGVYVRSRSSPAATPTTSVAPSTSARCARPGVAGAWSFADDERRDHGALARRRRRSSVREPARAVAARRAIDGPHVFAGPFETITPWQWDWFDTE